MNRYLCNMRKILLTILVAFNVVICHAHQDFYETKTYGNLIVRIKTGFKYEEINKLKIIGELGQMMLEKADYKEKVLIDFNHYYIGHCEPDYFIGYNNGSINYILGGVSFETEAVLPSSGLVVRILSSCLDCKKVLELLQYAIENKDYIKENQKTIEYEQNYSHWLLNSIDTVEVNNVFNHHQSMMMSEILKQKVHLADSTSRFGIPYFYQNNSFNFQVPASGKATDTLVLSVKNVYQMVDLSLGSKLVFDTDSSFYYLSRYGGDREVSKRHIIQNTKDNYRGFLVKVVGDDMLTIYFSRHSTIEEHEKGGFLYSQVSIYDSKNDKLIPDIRKNIIEK